MSLKLNPHFDTFKENVEIYFEEQGVSGHQIFLVSQPMPN